VSSSKKAGCKPKLVIDASVTLLWIFEDEHSAYAEDVLKALEEHCALAPHLWTLEVTNALLTAVRRKRLKAEELPILTQTLSALPIYTIPIDRDAVFQTLPILAQEFALTIYDASYLYLAEIYDLPLATADGKLKSAAEARRRFFRP